MRRQRSAQLFTALFWYAPFWTAPPCFRLISGRVLGGGWGDVKIPGATTGYSGRYGVLGRIGQVRTGERLAGDRTVASRSVDVFEMERMMDDGKVKDGIRSGNMVPFRLSFESLRGGELRAPGIRDVLPTGWQLFGL